MWPTREVDPATLYDLFWEAVLWLLKAEIVVSYCCCDGGEANRSFIKLHFKGIDPMKSSFTVINPYTKDYLTFFLDFPVSKSYRLSCDYIFVMRVYTIIFIYCVFDSIM